MSRAKGTSGGWSEGTKWAAIAGLGLSATAVVAIGLYYVWKRKNQAGIDSGDVNSLSRSPRQVQEPQDKLVVDRPSDEVHVPTKPLIEVARDMKLKGNDLFKQRNFSEAIKLYEEAIEICPPEEAEDLSAFHHNIAACLDNMTAGEQDHDKKILLWQKVIERCDRAIEFKPKYVKAIARRAKAYEGLGKKRDALLDVTRVLLLDETQAMQFRETTPRLLKSIGNDLAVEHYPKLGDLAPPKQLVKSYFSSYSWKDDLSRARLEELWNATHDTPDGFSTDIFVEASTLYRQGHYSDLLKLLTRCIDEGDQVFKPHARSLRGSFYCLWRKDQLALTDFENVIASKDLSSEMYADAHIKRAAIYGSLCNLQKCYEEFDKAIEKKRDHADIYLQRGRVCMESEDLEVIVKSKDDFNMALKLSPNSPHTLYCLGAACHRIGLLSGSTLALEEAKEYFETAYNTFPTCVEGLILYSLFLQDANDIAKSEEILEKAIETEPDNASAHFSLSIIYLLAHQDMARAINSLETAIAMDSSCVQAYQTLASLEMQRGNKDRSHELYQLAINNSRSILEMQQAYTAYEVFTTQDQACQELGIDPLELASSRMMGAI